MRAPAAPLAVRRVGPWRFNEPYEVSIRIERDAIVWRTHLTDRTPPTMIRGLLEELPRLQWLLLE